MEIVFRIFDDVNLVGDQIEGKKHGEFYYVFADGYKEYAGAYQFDQKHGIWYDIQSYVKHDCYGFYRQYKMNTSNYFNGIRLPIIGKLDYKDCRLQFGKKQGEWIETQGVHRCLFEKGTYCDNKRIGAWITYYDGHICGRGSYNDEGIKIGQWIEADFQYDNGYFLTFSGEYDNGQRVGRWKYLNEQKEIGGGIYENGMKQGHWIELPEEIRLINKITEEGDYLNGKRVGYWVILIYDQLIGRGIYDENGLKQGHWIEPHNTLQDPYLFLYSSLTTCFGEYAKGLRKGEWTYLCQNQKIGGGNYNLSGQKTGKWIEPHDLNIEITYSGEYKEGVQVGNWKTFFSLQEIGGGYYDEKGVKIGYWIELFKNSHNDCQRIQKGLYEKGTRIGKWKIILNSKEIQSEYWGEFDIQGMKTGQWIEPSERNANHEIKLKFTGKYNKGLRTGRWKTLLNEELIGGGIYDDHGKKKDRWVDIHELEDSFLTFHGLYEAGIKKGQWEIKKEAHIKIGGGDYDTNGIKFDEWHDLDERFQEENYESFFIFGHKTLINCVGMYHQNLNQYSQK